MSGEGSAEKRGRLAGPLVVATHNAGKLREIRELVEPYGVEAVSAAELDLDEPEETGVTFSDNAALKAEAAARASGIVALADDSGLCVDALDGAPGIYSARWAGGSKETPGAAACPASSANSKRAPRRRPRRASFVSVLALAWPRWRGWSVRGAGRGTLVFPPRGTAGFGYDPIFRPDGHDQTFGEMSAEEKHGIPADGSPRSRIAPARSEACAPDSGGAQRKQNAAQQKPNRPQ